MRKSANSSTLGRHRSNTDSPRDGEGQKRLFEIKMQNTADTTFRGMSIGVWGPLMEAAIVFVRFLGCFLAFSLKTLHYSLLLTHASVLRST